MRWAVQLPVYPRVVSFACAYRSPPAHRESAHCDLTHGHAADHCVVEIKTEGEGGKEEGERK